MESHNLPANEFEPLPPMEMSAGMVAAAAREQHEVQAAIISAKKFPRDENASFLRVTKSFSRAGLADDAMWSFPRGGQKISGPSVQAARELARCWGNITFGLRVVDVDDTYVHIKGRACDLESNTCVEAEDKFEKKIQRKNSRTGISEWVVAVDERDLRELINRRGSILVRNCILQIIPPDVIDSAMDRARKTKEAVFDGKLQKNRDETIRELVVAFAKHGVSIPMLEQYLGHALVLVTHTQLVDLGSIFSSLKDGQVKREEVFDVRASSAGAKDLNAET